MNQKDKNRAIQIFEKSDLDLLYMNKKGNFFTCENLALNSVKDAIDQKDRKIEKIKRDDVINIDTEPPAKSKIIKNKA